MGVKPYNPACLRLKLQHFYQTETLPGRPPGRPSCPCLHPPPCPYCWMCSSHSAHYFFFVLFKKSKKINIFIIYLLRLF